ncbi:hypothetical protein, partial [Enterobacter asburiae]|uniref:hypothetical protein n=1 Tax=Enterobacter asburiae TaxID=61645 RepID=UPI00307682CD
MNELDDLHNKIGQLLVDAGPANVMKLIARAKLSLDGESCEYVYDYLDQEGDEDWFVPDKLASHDLRLLLVKMRDFYIQNNMTKEGANKQVISSQADSLIKISRIWA